jgi:peptide/nickel transport system substrate-binding protein
MVWPEFARMLVNGPDSSFHLIGMSPDSRDTQDAFTGYIMTRDPDANEGFFNWALFTDSEIDDMTRELTETFDEQARDDLYRRLIERAKAQVNAVYLHQPMIVWAMRDGVDAPIRADATVTLQNVTVR